jgi:hypothetical protein
MDGEHLMQMTMGVIYDKPLPLILRLLGARWSDGGREWRMRWGSLSIRQGWACELCLFSEDRFALRLHALRVQVFISLPFLSRFAWEPAEMMESWGASCADGTLHLHWGAHSKLFWLPWRHWERVSHNVRRPDGSWAPYVGIWERDKEPDGRHVETHPYRYVLRSGQVQQRTATIYVERDRRKLTLFRWLPFARTRYYIDVAFSDEVGERSGSWKGGTVGCAYELRPNETPRECLRRMERERKFD